MGKRNIFQDLIYSVNTAASFDSSRIKVYLLPVIEFIKYSICPSAAPAPVPRSASVAAIVVIVAPTV